jgi:opacity protein-like surface antigen
MYSWLRTPASAGVLIVCAFFGSSANAQEGGQQEPSERPQQSGPRATLIGPLSIGLRLGFVVGDLVDGSTGSSTDTSVSPFRTTEGSGESTSGHVGWGPTLQLNFTRRISLNVDLLRRSVGYNSTTTVVDEATEDDDAQFVSERFETVSAKFWDLAVLPRYRFGAPDKPRFFLTGGMALRSLSNERGTVRITDEDRSSETEDLDVQAANSAVRGGVIGAGIQIRDDVGFKLELEFRYTRWFRRTFETSFANSQKHQTEILLGLTF